MKFTLQAKDDVPFATPVISQVSRRALDHADTNASELLRAPVREPTFAFVLGWLDLGPVCNFEWNANHLHGYILLVESLRLRRARQTPKRHGLSLQSRSYPREVVITMPHGVILKNELARQWCVGVE